VKEYKVMSQKDKWFSKKFDPEALEQGLNAYAEEGWQVISIATATIASITGAREEMVVVFEREK
jgi:hypothetical protein